MMKILLPDDTFAAGHLVDQEGEDRCFLSRCVSLKRFGPETPTEISEICLSAVSLHILLKNLRHVISV